MTDAIDLAHLPVADGDLARLHADLVRRADRDGALDVTYRLVDSPLGALLLATTARGLVRVAFGSEGIDAVLTDLADRLSPRILESPAHLDAPARQIDDYLAGRRRDFDVPLDRALSHGFRGEVHRYLSRIGYGQVESYKQVAAHVGNPAAVRAVGSACATNPLPIVVPCHRVLRSDGSLGGYVGGLDVKRALLDLERAA